MVIDRLGTLALGLFDALLVVQVVFFGWRAKS
jgi:hypothetical protein